MSKDHKRSAEENMEEFLNLVAESGWSRKETAEELGCSPALISNVITGTRKLQERWLIIMRMRVKQQREKSTHDWLFHERAKNYPGVPPRQNDPQPPKQNPDVVEDSLSTVARGLAELIAATARTDALALTAARSRCELLARMITDRIQALINAKP